MKNMKRLITALLALAMVLTVLPAPFAAAAQPASEPAGLQSLHPFEGTQALIRDAVEELQAQGQTLQENDSNDADKAILAGRLMQQLEAGESTLSVADLQLTSTRMDRLMEQVLQEQYLAHAISGLAYTLEGDQVTTVRFAVSEGYRNAAAGLNENRLQLQAVPQLQDQVLQKLPGGAVSAMEATGETPACLRHTVADGMKFDWGVKVDSTPVVDEQGNVLNGGLLYDAEHKAIVQGILPKISWQLNGVSYHCSVCDQDIVITRDDPIMDQQLNQMCTTYEVYADLPNYNPQTGEGLIQVPSSEPQPEPSPTLLYCTQVVVAQFVDDTFTMTEQGPVMGENGLPMGLYMSQPMDNGALEVNWYYNMLSAFFADHAEYYGVAGDYWTSMNSEANPMAALKALCNMDPNADMPPAIMSQLVQMLPQAFMAYVHFYGNELLAMRDQAMALVNALPQGATSVQKLLVLHDWLAENAVFDMGAMVNVSASGGAPETDPIQMTPFGAMLSHQLTTISGSNYYGCICLGYASAYSYLIQNAFPEVYKNSDGSWCTPAQVDANGGDLVDFGQVMFYADTAETSIAGEGFGGGFFNNVHYFNLVRVKDAPTMADAAERMTGDWFFVDSCYNDIFVECLSQYRAEADGSLHHDYFLVSPQTMDKVWHPNIDYISHLHDGYTYQILRDEQGNPVPYPKDSPRYNPADPMHPQYEKVAAENEQSNDNTCYEQSWFSGAVSKIYHDGANWYYVDAEDSSLTYAEKMDENGNLTIDREQVDKMGVDIRKSTHSRRVDKTKQDKIKSRPMSAPDYWVVEEEQNNSSSSSSMPEFKKDPHSAVIFDYGTGKFTNGGTDLQAVVDLDFQLGEQFPGLTHSLGLWQGELYFNLANSIYAYSPAAQTCRLVKQYHDVSAATDGRAFTASSYTVAQEGQTVALQVRDNPIAGLVIADRYTPLYNYVDSQGQVVISFDGKLAPGYESMEQAMAAVVGRVFVMMLPQSMMTVSVGTNYTFTAAFADGMTDEEKSASRYTKEAVNFNPEYAKQMEPLLKPEERFDNSNEEFLWCANIREDIPAQALTELTAQDVPFRCADGHQYVYNQAEDAWICSVCGLHAANIAEDHPTATLVLTAQAESGSGMMGSSKFVDAVSPVREAATKDYGRIHVEVRSSSGPAVQAVSYLPANAPEGTKPVLSGDKNVFGKFTIEKPDGVGCIVVSPVFEPVYLVDLNRSRHGEVTADPLYNFEGDRVILRGTPDKGYLMQAPVVSYEVGEGLNRETVYVDVQAVPGEDSCYSFMMPASDVEVDTSFVEGTLGQAPVVEAALDPQTGKPVLSWTAVAGADSYEIWRCAADGSYSLVLTTAELTATDADAAAGAVYRYKVRAVTTGTPGAYSEAVEAVCVCSSPVVTVSTGAEGEPVLSWDSVEGAVSYEIFRAAADGEFSLLQTVEALRFNDTTAEAGVTYSYKVRAVCADPRGNSAFSEIVTAARESEPEPQKPFELVGTNMIMGNNLDLMFAIPADARTDWTGCYVVIGRSYADQRPADEIRIDFADWQSSQGIYMVTYQGLAAKEMTDVLTVTVYDAEDQVISVPKSDSIRSYAMRLLGKSKVAEQKTLLVDMLNYGAAAQKHFDYAVADLADKELSDEQKALGSTLKPFESKLDRGSKWYGSNLVLESNIRLMVAFRDINPGMTATVDFVNHMGDKVHTVIAGSAFQPVGDLYAVVIEDLVVADARQPVTVTITDAEGNTVTTCQESIEDYLARMNQVSDLFAAVMKFSDSAYTYLHMNDVQ